MLSMTLVVACPNLLGHLQVQGISGTLRPRSLSICMACTPMALVCVWPREATLKFNGPFSDTPLEGWIVY